MRLTQSSVVMAALCAITGFYGCSSESDGGDASGGGAAASGGAAAQGGAGSTSCSDLAVIDVYPEATNTGECTTEAGLLIASSMMNLDGITIDNVGEEMTPCLRVECDSDYAYVISNNLPHYDFVQLTPNALTESLGVQRIPLVPTAPAGSGAADISTLNGCETAYDAYVAGTGVVTPEPSGYCGDGYLTETKASGTHTYAQVACMSQFAIMNSGVMANGPNEGDVGVWGDPGLEPANQFAEGPGASVDYCGGHTGRSMHYHSAFEACFEMDEARKPTLSYAKAAMNWNQLGLITDACTEPSGIVGWSIDGYPIKGPCVCTEQAEDGSCTAVKRARSSWLYRGFGRHAPDPQSPDPSLAVEGQACASRDDCCTETPCDFTCNHVVTDGVDAGSGVEQVCTFTRYAWCTRAYENLESQDVSAQDFVYLDVCNGYEAADGFAYRTTGTFPYMQGCFHGEPAEQAAAEGGGGPPPTGGGPPPGAGGGPPGGM